MRAVWSFWTKPFWAQHHTHWLSLRHHLFSWVLSVQSARRHYPRTALFTDDDGARLLVDQLGLQFGEVSTELNALTRHNESWWALGKVWTYRAQTEPFIHLDSDVFLWNPLPESLTAAPVLAQCPEFIVPGSSCYRPEVLEREVSASGQIWLPAEWVWYRSVGIRQHAASCGIFGGNRLDFIQYYADQAIKLIEHPDNQRGWLMMDRKDEHNILFEQYLLAACLIYHRQRANSPYHGIEIRYLFESLDEAFVSDRAAQLGYTHLIAGAKLNKDIARRLELRVERDYPDYYERCLQMESNGNGRSANSVSREPTATP